MAIPHRNRPNPAQTPDVRHRDPIRVIGNVLEEQELPAGFEQRLDRGEDLRELRLGRGAEALHADDGVEDAVAGAGVGVGGGGVQTRFVQRGDQRRGFSAGFKRDVATPIGFRIQTHAPRVEP